MIVRCNGCGGALTYDVATGKMKCKYCGSMIRVERAGEDIAEKTMLECNIYSCTACGAELAVNDVEAATFCAYCGQPAIVFDRVTQMYKPEKIIPFKITKEQAVAAVRKRFRKGFFVPKAIKNFKVEHMVGIYVPFWLYDITYYDNQKYVADRDEYRYSYYREAEAVFKSLPVDASSNVHNDLTHRLEPFYMAELKNFRESYLSGFYADRYDEDEEEIKAMVGERSKVLFDAKVLESIPFSGASLEKCEPRYKVDKKVYAMFPIWFMTLRYEDTPYTMLVNGQTGKMVGTVPVHKKKVGLVFGLLFAILAPMLSCFCGAVYDGMLFKTFWYGELSMQGWILCIAASLGALLYVARLAKKSWNIFHRHIAQTAARKMEHFSKQRQKGDK